MSTQSGSVHGETGDQPGLFMGTSVFNVGFEWVRQAGGTVGYRCGGTQMRDEVE